MKPYNTLPQSVARLPLLMLLTTIGATPREQNSQRASSQPSIKWGEESLGCKMGILKPINHFDIGDPVDISVYFADSGTEFVNGAQLNDWATANVLVEAADSGGVKCSGTALQNSFTAGEISPGTVSFSKGIWERKVRVNSAVDLTIPGNYSVRIGIGLVRSASRPDEKPTFLWSPKFDVTVDMPDLGKWKNVGPSQ